MGTPGRGSFPERAFYDRGPAGAYPHPTLHLGPFGFLAVEGTGPLFPGGGQQRRGAACLSAPLPQRHYEWYHGFVVIHGTDTMAFAASVLSFVLENLQKTVILTGAQVTPGWLLGPKALWVRPS